MASVIKEHDRRKEPGGGEAHDSFSLLKAPPPLREPSHARQADQAQIESHQSHKIEAKSYALQNWLINRHG